MSSNLKLKKPETSSQRHTKPIVASHKFGNTDYPTKTSSTPYSSVRKSDIKFYHIHEPYYEFTNFAQYPIKLDGKQWPTTEHYFQAQKFIGTPYEEAIRKQFSARGAFDMSRNPAVFCWLRGDWEIVKNDIMLKCLRAKFTQHEILMQKLLATGDRKLIEHTTNDSYWGDGGDGSGLNVLGKLLMQVRKELSSKHQSEKSASLSTLHKLLPEHKVAASTSAVKHKKSGLQRSHSFNGSISTRSTSLTSNNVREKEFSSKWSSRHSSLSTTPTAIPGHFTDNLPSSKRFGSTGNMWSDRHNSLHSHASCPTSTAASVHFADNISSRKRFGSTGNISGSMHHTISSDKNTSSSSRHSFGKTNTCTSKKKNGFTSYVPHRYGSHGALDNVDIVTWQTKKY